MLLSATDTHFNLINDLATLIMLVSALAIQSIINWLRNRKPRKEITSGLDIITSKVERMEKELAPNGGTSIKDMVTNTHKKVLELDTTVKSIRVQQRARLEMQLNVGNEYVLLFNEDGECTFANEATQVLFGMQKHDILYAGWLQAIHDTDERERISESWDFHTNKQIALREHTTVCNQISRTKTPATLTINPIWDDEGNPLWFLGKIKIDNPKT